MCGSRVVRCSNQLIIVIRQSTKMASGGKASKSKYFYAPEELQANVVNIPQAGAKNQGMFIIYMWVFSLK